MTWKKVMFGVLISLVFLLGHSAYADSGGNDYIVYLKPPQIKIRVGQGETNKNYITVSEDELQKLLKDDKVAFYEPNCEVRLFEDFSNGQATEQWNFNNINLSKAWQIGCYGNDVKVGVIDSGVYNTSFGYGLISIQAMIDEMLKDTKVFISPVEKLDAGLRVKIYNNGDKTLTATGIVAKYENKRFVGLSHENVSLLPGETTGLNSKQSNNVKFMLWNGFDNMNPLAAYRKN